MLVSEPPPARFQHQLLKVAGGCRVTLGPEQGRKIARRSECQGIFRTQNPFGGFSHVLLQRPGLVVLPLLPRESEQSYWPLRGSREPRHHGFCG